MSDEPVLAYTVHHKGRKYRAGTTAAMIGPAAADIGAHAWVDGNAPKKAEVPEKKEGEGDGGRLVGSPPVPPPSALPTGGPGVQTAEPEESADAAAPRKATGGRRGGQG